MLTKTTRPILEMVDGKNQHTGMKTEYRLFGILFYVKTLRYLPAEFERQTLVWNF